MGPLTIRSSWSPLALWRRPQTLGRPAKHSFSRARSVLMSPPYLDRGPAAARRRANPRGSRGLPRPPSRPTFDSAPTIPCFNKARLARPQGNILSSCDR